MIAHNNWTDYMTGSRWNIIFDIAPEHGHRFIMDGMPGLIHSGDDFGINAAGIMITETTITGFNGFDPDGVPKFVRARKAMQYSASIDDFARIMKEGNNGGYANDWLIADRNTGEIASLELGLKHVNLWRRRTAISPARIIPSTPRSPRTKPISMSTIRASAPTPAISAGTICWPNIKAASTSRWAKKFLGDHYDTFAKKIEPDERTLCGHIELSTRGSKPWQPPYGTAGAVQNKVADATMAAAMSFSAAMGHSCGIDFKAAKHLKAHPEFAWQKSELRDLDSHPFTTFTVSK